VTLDVGTGTAALAGQNFINNSGAGALATTGAGKWRVWSSNPASDTRGGLAYDFKQYNAVYGATTVAQATGNGFLYTLAPTITAGLTGKVSKAYDTTIKAPLSAANYSVSGAVDGDTVILNPTSGSFDNVNVGTGKTVSVSGITVVSASNGTANVYGYSMDSASVNDSEVIGEITANTNIDSALNARTQLAANVLSPQANVRPGALILSPTIMVAQDLHTDSVTGVNIGSTGPALQIESGGIRLPDNMINVNKPEIE